MSMDWLSVAFNGKSRSEYPGNQPKGARNERFLFREGLKQQVCHGKVLITPAAVKTLLGPVLDCQMETLGSDKC